MNIRLKRWTALIMTILMIGGICPESVFAAEMQEDQVIMETVSEETTEDTGDVKTDNGQTEGEETDNSQEVDEADQTVENAGTETGATGTETDTADTETDAIETETGITETNTAESLEVDSQLGTLIVSRESTLALTYDDRYSFDTDYPGYVIVSVETSQVTSYQVSAGSKTDSRDEAVLAVVGDSETSVRAVGVGTASVLLTLKEDSASARAILAEDYTGKEERIEVVKIDVSVEAAPLTMLFLAGQSNMEGYSAAASGYHPEDSIVCEEGQVYSTFVYHDNASSHIAGLSLPASYSSAETVTAASLTGDTARDGSTLQYPLNALTEAGNGKTGPDSGLAYEWHKLTGDKVWIINAAVSGTVSRYWVPGSTYYERALAVYEEALKTLEAEVSAGHYAEGQRLLIWQQGETDGLRKTSAENYLSNFREMYAGLKVACGLDACGIIVARAHSSANEENDTAMTGARIAQYLLAISREDTDVYMVSNVNEQWVTDEGVSSYFKRAYPDGSVSYPLRITTSLNGLPSTVSEVHSDVHYSQVAHNENGLTAARGMYEALYGGAGSVTAGWLDENGDTMTDISCSPGEEVVAVPYVSPSYCAKQLLYEADGKYLSYNESSGSLTALKKGTSVLKITDGRGYVQASLRVAIGDLRVPVLSSARNTASGVLLSWSETPAANYYIYRKTASSGWTRIAVCTSESYTDDSAKSGISYTYTVRACYAGVLSDYDKNGISILCVGTPVLVSASNLAAGIEVKWGAVEGAVKYGIYRKTDNGSWSRLDYVKTTGYIDKTAESGNKYSYTVVAFVGSVSGAYDKDGKSVMCLTQPVLRTVKNGSGSVNVTWNVVEGAEDYLIYRRTGTGSWSRVGISEAANYTDTTISSNTRYTYTVRARGGGAMSAYDAQGGSVTYLSTPVLSSAVNCAMGVRVSWAAVAGAQQYYVYRSNTSGGWTRIGTVKTTSYTDTSVVSGVNYRYTVVAWSNGGSSAYDRTGKSVIYLKQPTIGIGRCGSDYITVEWDAISGAEGYLVYRKSGSSGWKRIADVAGGDKTSYSDTGVAWNTAYTYTVRAYAEGTMSSYHGGKSGQCVNEER